MRKMIGLALMHRSYRIALLCGILPLVAGVGIYLVWLVAKWESLMVAGLFTIIAGMVCTIVAAISLGLFWRNVRRNNTMPQRRAVYLIAFCAAILAMDYLAAGIIACTAHERYSAYNITVCNESLQPIENIHLSGGGIDYYCDRIAAGKAADCILWFKQDGSLQFSAVCGSTTYAETVDNYVTGGMGGMAIITIRPDYTISIDHDIQR
jgi:hypothetical protein